MDDEGSRKLQSNEEVIEELTRDLESSCIRVDENSTENIPSDANTKTRDIKDGSWDVIDAEQNESNNDSAQNTDLLEDVDEELLKDREVNLTEAEKEVSNFSMFEYLCYLVLFLMQFISKQCTTILWLLFLQALKDEAEKLKNEGNALFKTSEYVQAILVYTQGLQACPLVYSKERSILYANRAAAKAKCQVIAKSMWFPTIYNFHRFKRVFDFRRKRIRRYPIVRKPLN